MTKAILHLPLLSLTPFVMLCTVEGTEGCNVDAKCYVLSTRVCLTHYSFKYSSNFYLRETPYHSDTESNDPIIVLTVEVV